MKYIIKAGCVLLDLDKRLVGLVYRDRQGDYSFAKGHLEDGETLQECAVRETEEEISRKCAIIETDALPTLSYIDSAGDCVIVHYFMAQDLGPSMAIVDDELVHQPVWVALEQFTVK